MKNKKKVAILGTHGIPAKYGGFETLAENLVAQLSDRYHFSVYCNKRLYADEEKENSSVDFQPIYLPFSASGWQSYIFDFISFLHAFIYSKTIIYLGPTFGILTAFNVIFRRNIITNYGGLNEWERPKYSRFQKWLFKTNIAVATNFSSWNVVDNMELKRNLQSKFRCEATVIRYGGDHFGRPAKLDDKTIAKYPFLGGKYYLCVARAQIDTNLHLLIDSFNRMSDCRLVIVSNWNVSAYGRDLKSRFSQEKNLVLLDAIYDANVLNLIRRNCYLYIHSHSYCGTAPSLVEAICLRLPIVCYDVATNRETTRNKSIYFSNEKSLCQVVEELDDKAVELLKMNLELLIENYTWEAIGEKYRGLID